MQNFRRRGGQGGGQPQQPPRIEFDIDFVGGCNVMHDRAAKKYHLQVAGWAKDGNQPISAGRFVYGTTVPQGPNLVLFVDGVEETRVELGIGTGRFDWVHEYSEDEVNADHFRVMAQIVGTTVTATHDVAIKKTVRTNRAADVSGWKIKFDHARAERIGDNIKIRTETHVEGANGLLVPADQIGALGTKPCVLSISGHTDMDAREPDVDGRIVSEVSFKPHADETSVQVCLAIRGAGVMSFHTVDLPQVKVDPPKEPPRPLKVRGNWHWSADGKQVTLEFGFIGSDEKACAGTLRLSWGQGANNRKEIAVPVNGIAMDLTLPELADIRYICAENPDVRGEIKNPKLGTMRR